MTKDDFLSFVKDLRALGAVAVEAGDLKVSFSDALSPSLLLPDAMGASWDFEALEREVADQEPPVEGSAAHKQWLRDQYGSSG